MITFPTDKCITCSKALEYKDIGEDDYMYHCGPHYAVYENGLGVLTAAAFNIKDTDTRVFVSIADKTCRIVYPYSKVFVKLDDAWTSIEQIENKITTYLMFE